MTWVLPTKRRRVHTGTAGTAKVVRATEVVVVVVEVVPVVVLDARGVLGTNEVCVTKIVDTADSVVGAGVFVPNKQEQADE